MYSANTPAIYFARGNILLGVNNFQALPRNVSGPFNYDPTNTNPNYQWPGTLPRLDPRCYFLCNSTCILDLTTGLQAVDLSLNVLEDGTYIAEANFVLNITCKWHKFNTAPSFPFEDFALFGQFHSEKYIGGGNPPVSGIEDFTMENVGVSANSTGKDKPEFGDLIISYSNLDAQSQSNSGRDVYGESFIPIPAQGPTGIEIRPGTNYSFPISFRKRVKVVAGTPIYLALSLFRSPSDIPDFNYNEWMIGNPPDPLIASYEYPLKYPLPFEYNIIYEPYATNSSIPNGISNWQGIAGFSTNLSLSKPL